MTVNKCFDPDDTTIREITGAIPKPVYRIGLKMSLLLPVNPFYLALLIVSYNPSHHFKSALSETVGLPSMYTMGMLYFLAFFLMVLHVLMPQALAISFHPQRIIIFSSLRLTENFYTNRYCSHVVSEKNLQKVVVCIVNGYGNVPYLDPVWNLKYLMSI